MTSSYVVGTIYEIKLMSLGGIETSEKVTLYKKYAILPFLRFINKLNNIKITWIY
jgi:hypothetical protein